MCGYYAAFAICTFGNSTKYYIKKTKLFLFTKLLNKLK